MISRFAKLSLFVAASLIASVSVRAEVVSATIQAPPSAETGYFKMGTTKNPAGHEISVNSRSLLFDGAPVFPVMGEMHYSRVPQAEWREELLKMKAGGVDIVATYVFWIHHEEVEGQWDWGGQRDLKKFVQTCNELGLKVIVRCGPWCHGEVRNGGFPDWVVAHKDWKLRSTDTNFLAAVKPLYSEISKQLEGELWKDGGPVIGIQVDNEFGGSPNYLMALKKIAIEAGLDVPLYIKTGWPAMRTPVPLGELLPLFGAYPDGFWERSIKPMDGSSWENFIFKRTRTDTGVGNDTLGNRKDEDTAGTEKYPHLTCEVGGGMPASYHRRINYDPRDMEAVVMTQLGSGSSLLGYYMYHGGQNPEGKLSTLQESQATGYPNDLPVKTYDFNAPIGEFGQINPQYYWLRRLHLFLHEFGAPLAQMPLTLPDVLVAGKNDLSTLRWAVRSSGNTGYVFVNNYQRLQPLGEKRGVQFKLKLPDGELVFPQKPVTVPADAFFFWPFNLNLAGVNLDYATAQPICMAEEGEVQIFYFGETPGVKAEFIFTEMIPGPNAMEPSRTEFHNVKPGRKPAITIKNRLGEKIQIVLLSEADSLAMYKDAAGKVVFDEKLKVSVTKVKTEMVQPAGPARENPLSGGKSHVAIAPTDEDFTNAAVWKIKLPADAPNRSSALLRIRYAGDVARLTLNGKLIADNFYAGRTFDLGLKRYAPEIFSGELRLEILPLRKDAPIYIEPKDRPDFRGKETVLELKAVEVVR
ncbi:MAG TPA: beta-galactosidase [Candidatus Acidoferrales bacterium]|nr:beta-galactosidase [Candidatus Acidoferrales bacterium]